MWPKQSVMVTVLACILVSYGDMNKSNVHNFNAKSITNQQTGNGYLAEINPWLSACDVANPIKAPDLQVNKFSNTPAVHF